MQRVWRLRGPARVPPHPSSPTLPQSLQYLDNSVCAGITPPACCAIVYVSLFKVEQWEGGMTQRSPVLLLTFISVFSPGGTRWRLRGKDRQGITSVMSAKVQVCPEQMLGSPESLLFFTSCVFIFFFFTIFFFSPDDIAGNKTI